MGFKRPIKAFAFKRDGKVRIIFAYDRPCTLPDDAQSVDVTFQLEVVQKSMIEVSADSSGELTIETR